MPYEIANVRIEGGGPEAHLRIGWMRSVGNIHHAFAVNSFACELALAAGRDPGQYLLDLIGPDRLVDLGKDTRYSNYGMPLEQFPIDTGRLRQVTETVMKAANWGAPLPPGHGLGIAAHRSFLSYVATVVEVAAGADGKITVQRLVSAADVGRIINPERLRSQLEGGAIFGLSLAMYGEISTRNGQVQQSNFHDYPVLRMHESPNIDIHLIDSEHVPTGAGEPPTPPVSGALCNAIQAATGQRIRRLPLSRHGLI
jgi:isoquinoline 1-oxidoreductase beta subunit